MEEVVTNVLPVPHVVEKIVVQTEEKVIIEPVEVVKQQQNIEREVEVREYTKHLVRDQHH